MGASQFYSQKGKPVESSLQFCGAIVLQRTRCLCRQVRDDAENCKYLFLSLFYYSAPLLFSFPCTSPKLSLVAASSPRQQHLSPGLFLPSLFGITISSRTNPRPINNSSLLPCLLPLPRITPSSFLLASSVPSPAERRCCKSLEWGLALSNALVSL